VWKGKTSRGRGLILRDVLHERGREGSTQSANERRRGEQRGWQEGDGLFDAGDRNALWSIGSESANPSLAHDTRNSILRVCPNLLPHWAVLRRNECRESDSPPTQLHLHRLHDHIELCAGFLSLCHRRIVESEAYSTGGSRATCWVYLRWNQISGSVPPPFHDTFLRLAHIFG